MGTILVLERGASHFPRPQLLLMPSNFKVFCFYLFLTCKFPLTTYKKDTPFSGCGKSRIFSFVFVSLLQLLANIWNNQLIKRKDVLAHGFRGSSSWLISMLLLGLQCVCTPQRSQTPHVMAGKKKREGRKKSDSNWPPNHFWAPVPNVF